MDMIRRLHRKFIWMATASVVAIIVLAVGLINGSLYVRVHHEISSITDIISQNGGTIPSDLAPQEKGLFEFGNWAEETPEFSYQARYFSILFDANKKEAKVINVNHIAAFKAKESFTTQKLHIFPEFMSEKEKERFRREYRDMERDPDKEPTPFYLRWYKWVQTSQPLKQLENYANDEDEE